MAVLQIARLGNPILRAVAKEYAGEAITSGENQRFFNDLLETMRAGGGIGLAAPQVFRPSRVIALENRLIAAGDAGCGPPPDIIVDPVWEPLSNEMMTGWEGCLSIENMRGKVSRFKAIKVGGFDREGLKLDFRAIGLSAVVIQHETDHLDGILFIDTVNPPTYID